MLGVVNFLLTLVSIQYRTWFSLSYCYESAGICRVSVMLQKIMFCKPGGARSRVLWLLSSYRGALVHIFRVLHKLYEQFRFYGNMTEWLQKRKKKYTEVPIVFFWYQFKRGTFFYLSRCLVQRRYLYIESQTPWRSQATGADIERSQSKSAFTRQVPRVIDLYSLFVLSACCQ